MKKILMFFLLPGYIIAGEATFAGGCFWCVEQAFDQVPGVTATISGYTGGIKKNPSYEEVSSGTTRHAEAVRVFFDESQVSYEQLLRVFWHSIDPTTTNQQFCDFGSQYRSAIFYHNEEQRQLAEASKLRLLREGRFDKVVTEIEAVGPFFPAEAYHQNYYQKNPLRYKTYRWLCGRDQRLEELWGDDAFLEK